MLPTSSTPSDSENRPLRILLVDDSAQVRQELGQLLELSGMVQIVGEAVDGLEAIRLAAELSPEVIVMDLEMPGMDGCAATRQIKQCLPTTRVVMLSVHARPEDKLCAQAAGVDRFVVKGASYYVLLGAILGKAISNNSCEKGEIS
jgi:two-component system response regulator DesR